MNNNLCKVALIAAACLVTACGLQVDEPPQSSTPTSTQTVVPATLSPTATLAPTATDIPADKWANIDPTNAEVVFWHTYQGTRGAAFEAIITEFNATNLYNITVTEERAGDLDALFNATLSVLPSEERPNLVVAYQNHTATYLDFARGSVVDVQSLIASPIWGLGDEDDLIDEFFLADRTYPYAEGQYGIAPNRSMSVLYINQSWLAELGIESLPASPQQFREVACQAVEQSYTFGTTPAIGYALRIEASVLASWVLAFGGDVFSEDDLTYQYDSAEAVQAVEFLQQLVEAGCARVVEGVFEDQAAFARGQALFTVGSTAGIPFYQRAINDGSSFDWTVGPVPHTTVDPVQNVYGPSVSILHTSEEEDLASWLFMKFYLQEQPQVQWAEATGYYPVRDSAVQSLSDYRSIYPAYDDAFGLQVFVKVEPAVPDYETVRGFAEAAFRDILNGADVQERLSALNAAANSTLP